MASNLPPGVTPGMIPGNTSDDVWLEAFYEAFEFPDWAMQYFAPSDFAGVVSQLLAAIEPVERRAFETGRDHGRMDEAERQRDEWARSDDIPMPKPGDFIRNAGGTRWPVIRIERQDSPEPVIFYVLGTRPSESRVAATIVHRAIASGSWTLEFGSDESKVLMDRYLEYLSNVGPRNYLKFEDWSARWGESALRDWRESREER